MSFSNEKQLEEILYEAHNCGKYKKLLRKVKNLRQKEISGSMVDIYLKAWEKIK